MAGLHHRRPQSPLPATAAAAAAACTFGRSTRLPCQLHPPHPTSTYAHAAYISPPFSRGGAASSRPSACCFQTTTKTHHPSGTWPHREQCIHTYLLCNCRSLIQST
ncbi:unnamed protein product [Periconia digitata]|uniref:Uncharacterized protein n=1 Tax=Periconia digitata TaxID=1303443 RepID=A0A9W4UEK5_9PLEO|nr:unnamed protein product [Periconia digitata]